MLTVQGGPFRLFGSVRVSLRTWTGVRTNAKTFSVVHTVHFN